MRIQCHSALWPRSFLWVFLVCAIPVGMGAELVPYSLPSQQRVAPAPASPVEQRAAPPAISASYYQQFAKQAKALKPDQRAELKASLSQKRDQALQLGRVDEELHYRRLIYILDATK